MRTALTFDDVLLRPGYAGFDRADIDMGMHLTAKIRLAAPLVSSPMDTVTGSKLAIALAKAGGLGIIHRNLTVKDQAAEVAAVKAEGLIVGAAVGSNPGYEERVEALVKAGTDIILVDSAHGYTKKVIQAVSHIKTKYEVEVMGGNVATAEGAAALIAAGVDVLRVGMGPGAICTTRIVSGMGVPQLTAILETAAVAQAHGIPVVADGGMSYSGDIMKALAAGASAVMFGKIFAATIEAPGGLVKVKAADVPAQFSSILNGADSYDFKEYRAMGSLGAMKRGMEISSEDEFHGKNYTGDVLIPEGVEGIIPCTGSVEATVAKLIGGVTSGMYYVGARNIAELWQSAQFMQITQASLTESHPHHLHITQS